MENLIISTDKKLLNTTMIHEFLSERSYWAKGRTLETVLQSIDNSVCFGMYNSAKKQIGFARVITDYHVFAWVLDVFILEEYRGNAYGKKLINYIVSFPDFAKLKKMGLATADAHGLYKQYGFTLVKKPQNIMERVI